MRTLPQRFKVDIRVKPGSHKDGPSRTCGFFILCAWMINDGSVNKQLNDKERVAAALENPALLGVVEECLK